MTPFSYRPGLAVLVVVAGSLTACGDSDSTPPAAAASYTIGGTVSGLPSDEQVGLLNNGGDTLTLDANGAFTFATSVTAGSAYNVTVGAQPTNGACTVTSASGTANSNIASVAVTCVPTFTVGGTVNGLAAGGSVTLSSAAGSATVTADGSFTFPTRLEGGDAYAVTVTTQPTGQTCSVTRDAGTIGAASVTDVAVTCIYSTQYAYVLNHDSDTISTLNIDALTQVITPATTPAFTAQDGPWSISTNATGTLAAVSNNWAKTVSVYRIDGVTGALTALGTPVATGNLHPRSVAMTGSLVFVVATDLVNDNRLFTYRVDTTASTVTLTDTRTLPAGGGYATSVDVNGLGTLVVATVAGPSRLSVFSIDHANSALIEVASSPTLVLSNPESARFNPAGNLLFVASGSSNDVSVYGVSTAGALTEVAGSPFGTGGTFPTALAVDATGSLVFVTNRDSNNVSAFTVNATTGALTAATGSPFATGAGPSGVSVDRSTSLVFVSNRTAGTVSAFRTNAAAELTPMAGSPFTVGSEPLGIGFGP